MNSNPKDDSTLSIQRWELGSRKLLSWVLVAPDGETIIYNCTDADKSLAHLAAHGYILQAVQA